MAKPEFYSVMESFVGNLDGVEVEYHKGEVVPADDPAVKKMPMHFEEIVVRGGQPRGEVEQTTAAPGEKRLLRRRPKAKAKAASEPEPQGKAMTVAAMKGRE